MYTNDLNQGVNTTSINKRLIYSTSEVSKTQDFKDWIKGTATIRRWNKDRHEYIRSRYEVPSWVAAYNCYMNSVDVMDQVIKVPRRKEKSLHNKFLSYILGWSVHNAYAVYQNLQERLLDSDEDTSVRKKTDLTRAEFKRQICVGLIRACRGRAAVPTPSASQISEVHIPVPSVGKDRFECQWPRCTKKVGVGCSFAKSLCACVTSRYI